MKISVYYSRRLDILITALGGHIIEGTWPAQFATDYIFVGYL